MGNHLVKIAESTLKDVLIIEPTVFGDHRGFFMETFRSESLKEYGIQENFIQDNHSKSVKGTLRGLHYQIHPKAQGKLVRVTQGAVFDVAVDLRKNSPTYMKWQGFELNEENKKIVYIPAGFAHGFFVLSDTAEFLYKCTEYYSPEHEHGIMWNDPEIDIVWPDGEKILSDRDKNHPEFILAEMNF